VYLGNIYKITENKTQMPHVSNKQVENAQQYYRHSDPLACTFNALLS